ncbi:MAG: hypothetical protein ACRDTC_25105, partial [Pseudonocardiaceae bacterium]
LGVVTQEVNTPVGLGCTPAASNEQANFCGTGPNTNNGLVIIGGRPGPCGSSGYGSPLPAQ